MLLELLGAALLLGCASSQKTPTQKQSNKREFEEYDSFFDRHGNEHIVDDGIYTEKVTSSPLPPPVEFAKLFNILYAILGEFFIRLYRITINIKVERL